MSKISPEEAFARIDLAFDDFTDLVYNTDTLIVALEQIENANGGGADENIKLVAGSIRYYVQHLREDMGKVYDNVDLALLHMDRKNPPLPVRGLYPIRPVEKEEEEEGED